MRTGRLVASLVLLAACGDDNGGSVTPDAAPRPDAAGNPDAAVTPDAMPDAPPTPTNASRVWVIGDVLTDNLQAAGAFVDSVAMPATFPFGGATALPIMVTGVTNELPDQNAASKFDAAATKIALVADLQVATRFDLYAAGPAGENPVKLLEGTIGSPIEISAIAISPDGTKVAFVRDVDTDNANDLYVIDTTGTGTPVKVSPARPGAVATPADLDVFSDLAWSADSKYLAFSGDLTENGYNQAYVVDTSAATPTAVELLARTDITATAAATGTRGVSGASVRFDASGNVWFRARIGGDADQRFGLFSATTTGTRTAFALPARGDASAPDASTFAFTPDGTKIVFQADAPTAGAYNLFVQTLGQATATSLTANTVSGQLVGHTTDLEFSPSGAEVAVLATYEIDGNNVIQENRDPYVVKLDGTGLRRLAVLPTSATGRAFDQLVWSIDGTKIYAVSDYAVNNDSNLYVLDPAMTDQTPTLAVDPPGGGDVFRVVVTTAE